MTAIEQVRGILAAGRTRAEIDTLMAKVTAEILAKEPARTPAPNSVFREIAAERDALFGARFHPDYHMYQTIADQFLYLGGTGSHADQRTAILRTAAAATAWVEAIDRRQPPRTTCFAECDNGHMYDGACLLDPMIQGVIAGGWDNGRDRWVFRCEDQAGCDGILSLDHPSAAAARRAYDRHRREHHNTVIGHPTKEVTPDA